MVCGLTLPPYMANIFDTKNAGLPWETFSNASGKPRAIVRTSARSGSSSRNMIGCGMSPSYPLRDICSARSSACISHGACGNTCPVSNSDFRFDMTAAQPADAAS